MLVYQDLDFGVNQLMLTIRPESLELPSGSDLPIYIFLKFMQFATKHNFHLNRHVDQIPQNALVRLSTILPENTIENRNRRKNEKENTPNSYPLDIPNKRNFFKRIFQKCQKFSR